MQIRDSVTRRAFLRDLGISVSALPFLGGLKSLWADESTIAGQQVAKRLIIFFSPNGTLPNHFWPDNFGDEHSLELKPMLEPLAPFTEHMLMLKGVNNDVRGDGDGHMRGMSCLLTGTVLNPGNIQGGSDSPAGWASGISIDQEMRNFFQSDNSTRTRFGSLEFGVAVPNRADPWTRMCYAGNNQPVAPIDDPGQMFQKLYGGAKDREQVASVLDFVRDDLKRAMKKLSQSDRRLLEEHMEQVHRLESDIEAAESQDKLTHPEPEIDPEIELVNDNTPEISRMQIELLVSAIANDMARVASIQFMRSVGQARMRWLGVEEGHHGLSHKPDKDQAAQDQLYKINHWFAGQLAHLTRRLSEIPEPTGNGESLLDNTQIVWVNELGKGNSHALYDIPFLLIGGGGGFKTNRAIDFDGVKHNRLLLSLAHGLGHNELKSFGLPNFCEDGALDLS